MVYLFNLLTILALLVGCNRAATDNRATTEKPDLGWVRETAALYLSLAPTIQRESGFIYTDKCDSLTWSAYLAATGGKVDLTAATDGEGRWYRRPLSLPECYAAGESRSTISKDGLLATWWAFALNDVKGELQSQNDYIREHRGFAGDGRLEGADTYIPPGHVRTLQALISKVDGQRVSQRTPLPSGVDIADFILSYASLPCQGDFDCFQQGSLSLLRLYIHGTATAGDVSNAKAAREKGVDNPLWYVISSILDGTAIDGETIQQMTRDWARYPTDRLPTGEETCDEFSMQRPVNRICPGDTAPRAGLELILMTRWIDVFYP